MRRYAILPILAAAALSVAVADAKQKPDLRAQVFAAESSFAQTLAARDLTAFGGYVAQEAVFFGGRSVMRRARPGAAFEVPKALLVAARGGGASRVRRAGARSPTAA
jgi:hypothetical protein